MKKEWCKFTPQHRQRDPNFGEIIDFYLWTCPVERTAYLANLLDDYGWDASYKFKVLKQKLISVSSVEITFEVTTPDKLNETLSNYGQEEKLSCSEVVVIVNPDSEIKTLLKSIRNAFAHASFRIQKQRCENDYFYFLENRVS